MNKDFIESYLPKRNDLIIKNRYEIIKNYMDTKYTDEEYESKKLLYTHNQPYDKESLYYREIYEGYYPNTSHTIPFFWKQPFMNDDDPSAWCVEKNKD